MSTTTTSPRPSPTKPLASRDVNTSSPTKTSTTASKTATGDVMEKEGGNKPKSMEYYRQVLQSRLEEDGSNQKYVSPSDTIMSPCTAKLNAYKSKHFMKAKPQSLFAKMDSSKKAADAAKAEGEKEGKGESS